MRQPAFVYGANIEEAVVPVYHSLLDRASDESAYRSVCPVCKHGVLLIRRDEQSFKLLRDDRCISCGQAFRYVDASVNGEPFER